MGKILNELSCFSIESNLIGGSLQLLNFPHIDSFMSSIRTIDQKGLTIKAPMANTFLVCFCFFFLFRENKALHLMIADNSHQMLSLIFSEEKKIKLGT